MKRILLLLMAVAAVSAHAKTVELTVDADTMLSAALAAAGKELASGDTLVKKGTGKLTADLTFDAEFKLTVSISEGVLEITAPGQLGFENPVTVENGATLLVTSSEKKNMLKSRTLKLSGTGADGYRGALVIAGTPDSETQPMNYVTFELLADAAIAAKNPGTWGLFSNATLKMNNHVLTLVGDVESGVPQFRFRYKATIKDAAGIELKRAYLTSTTKKQNNDVAHSCNPTVPYLKMDATSKIKATDTMLLDCFSTYVADYGAQFEIGNYTFPVSGVEGSPTVVCSSTSGTPVFRVNKTYTARADDILAGNCLNGSSAGLKFGTNSNAKVIFEMDDWSKLVGGSKVYTVASVASDKDIAYTGILSITNTNVYASHWSLDKESDSDKLKLKWSANAPEGVVSVTDWGIEPGEANKAGNAEKFNAGVAGLAEGSTVWFPVGDWYFDGPVTMPDENKIKIELEANLAKLHYSNKGVSVTTETENEKTAVVIRVEIGAAVTVDEAIAAAQFETWPEGASLVKRGGGTLVASDTIKNSVGFIHVYDGVLQASKNGDLGKDGVDKVDDVNRIYVHDGASLLLTPETDETKIISKRTLQLEGSGYHRLKVPGALAFDTKCSWQVIYDSSIALEGDTVISSTGTAGQNGLFTYATLNMKSHSLTLVCDDDKQANFRFRSGRSIQNAGTIVLDRAKLSTTDHNVEISPKDALKVVLRQGGTLAPYRADFYDGIDSISGTSGRINADSADISVTLKNVSGPLTIDKKVTATITGVLGAKASNIAENKILTAEKAIVFAKGAKFALEKDVELPPTVDGEEAVYTIVTSATGIAGHLRTPGLMLGDYSYNAKVADDGMSMVLYRAGGLFITVR